MGKNKITYNYKIPPEVKNMVYESPSAFQEYQSVLIRNVVNNLLNELLSVLEDGNWHCVRLNPTLFSKKMVIDDVTKAKSTGEFIEREIEIIQLPKLLEKFIISDFYND